MKLPLTILLRIGLLLNDLKRLVDVDDGGDYGCDDGDCDVMAKFPT